MNALEILKWSEYCKKFELTLEELLYMAAIKSDKKEIITNSVITDSLKGKGYLTDKGTISLKRNPFDDKGGNIEKLSIIFRDTFPRIIIPTSKKPARTALNEIVKKMDWFVKNHEYSFDVIKQAVKSYVEYYESKNFEYMQTSSYFIKKDDKDKISHSSLAEWCERVLTEGKEINDDFYTDL